jgi:hypothetical protein
MKRISKQALRGLALAATLAALAAPQASAMHRDQVFNDPAARQETGTTSAAPTRVVTVETDGGFDWTDAGIGAAGSFALAMMGVGLGLVVRRPGRSRLAS